MTFEFGASRMLASFKFPYFASALWALTPVAKPGLGTMAVDKYWRLYYDPDVSWTVTQGMAVLVHEIGHLLRDHAKRAESLNDCDNELFNVAGDAEINDDIYNVEYLRDNWPFPPVLPKDFNEKDGELAEYYYGKLLKQKQAENKRAKQQQKQSGDSQQSGGQSSSSPSASGQESQNGQRGGLPKVDCGSGADGRTRDWDDGPPTQENPGTSNYTGELIRRQVAEKIKEHHQSRDRSRGDVPGDWLRWAEHIIKPHINWRKQLPEYIRQALATASGRLDYSRLRPNRRSQDMGVILPVLRAPDLKIGVVIDTSGSIGNDDIAASIAEVGGMLRLHRNVTVYSCDAAVANAQKITDPKNIKLIGGGGTDMRVGITQAIKERNHVVVVLTDGDTPWPDSPPTVPTIIGILNRPNVSTPSWARTVHISRPAPYKG